MISNESELIKVVKLTMVANFVTINLLKICNQFPGERRGLICLQWGKFHYF